MAEPTVDLVRIGPDDWRRHRDIRLAMLLDTPLAYGSTYAREAGFTEEVWRSRLEQAVWHALRDGLPLGAISLVRFPDQPDDEAALVAMWVASHARGEGVADLLVERLLDHATSEGLGRVVLDVADDNGRAAAFYRRMGFEPTGRRGTLPHNANVCESEMIRTLTLVSDG